jgi:Holliday junction resolvase RusA-like endonuclease
MKLIVSLIGACTDNKRKTLWNGQLHDSTEYMVWKHGAVMELRGQKRGPMLVPTFEAQLAYRVKVYMESKRTDQTNYLKSIQDVLTLAGVINDDRWVYPIFTCCEIDQKNPRVELEIGKYENNNTGKRS